VPTNQQVRVSLVTTVAEIGPNRKLIFAPNPSVLARRTFLGNTARAFTRTRVPQYCWMCSAVRPQFGTAEVTFSGYRVNI
jgi:hypothetical protein